MIFNQFCSLKCGLPQCAELTCLLSERSHFSPPMLAAFLQISRKQSKVQSVGDNNASLSLTRSPP